MTDGEAGTGAVGKAALALGFAGLLPQIAAVGMIALTVLTPPVWGTGIARAAATIVAILYPLFILSFLGGIWWGLAMRRGARQARLATIAVLPSLAAMALLGMTVASGRPGWSLVAIGSVIALTLIVDRSIVADGDAPAGWIRLRVPLSIGLGGLTIVAGALVGKGGFPA